MSINMKSAFLLCFCSLQISAEVLSNISVGKNLLLEPYDSIEYFQPLETNVFPELVRNNSQEVYGSTTDVDYEVADVEGQADVNNEGHDTTGEDTSDGPTDSKEGGGDQPVNADGMKFLLFCDPNDPEKFEKIFYGQNDSLRSSEFDPSKPTKILIHGYRGKHNANGSFPTDVKEAYLETKYKKDFNLFVLDWSALALPGPKSFFRAANYPGAVKNVRTAGERLAAFIIWLNKDFDVNLDRVHLIGHSLGAHVAGNAGNMVIKRLGHSVGRITGLDPAGPKFYHVGSQEARGLHATDAQYVDVIHTNGGIMGIYENIGAADFWMNLGAKPQPGCSRITSTSELQKLMSGTCSHRMATVFYANTIRNHEDFEQCACTSLMNFLLWGKKCCDRKVVFGEFSPAGTTGVFYMKYKVRSNANKDNQTGEATSKGGVWTAVSRWFSSL